jgi:hypothetical protein
LIAATISEVYQPIERFLAQTEHAAVPPLGALAPLDAFLLLQIARFLPQPPQVIDLSTAATAGATAVIWASNRRAIQAAQIVVDAAAGRRLEERLHNLGLTTDGFAFTPAARIAEGVMAPLLIVAPADQAVSTVALLAQVEAACLVVLDLGPVGDSPALETLLTVAGSATPYRLTLLRELAPSLASSQVAVVQRRDWPEGAAMLERLAELFRGNLDFLRLAHENVVLYEEIDALHGKLALQQVTPAQPAAPPVRPRPSVLHRLFRAMLPVAWRKYIRQILGQKSNPITAGK